MDNYLDYDLPHPMSPRVSSKRMKDAQTRVFCSFCPPPSQAPAVSVCNWEADWFRGCRKPFCIRHSFLLHEIKEFAGFTERTLSLFPRNHALIQNQQDLKKEEIRCCAGCKLLFLSSFTEKRKRLRRRRLALSISLLLFFVLIFLAVAFFIAKPVYAQIEDLVEKSRCETSFRYVPHLDTCISTNFSRIASTKDKAKIYSAYHKGPCISTSRAAYCICPRYFIFNWTTITCELPACAYESNQQVDYKGSCWSMQYSKWETPGQPCIAFNFYRAESDTCHYVSCPEGFYVLANGSCLQLPPYERFESIRTLPYAPEGKQRYSLYGLVTSCPRLANGTVIPFLDELGQLQCFNESMVDKYDRSLPPSLRTCQPEEILYRGTFGCHFSCPEFESYDFLLKKCMRPRWCSASNLFVSRSGSCKMCRYTVKRKCSDSLDGWCCSLLP